MKARDLSWLAAQNRPVVVLFNAHGNSLGVVRSLAHHGVPVVVLSPAVDLATRSHLSRWIRSPPYRSREFVDLLLKLGEKLVHKGVVIPLQDHLVRLCLDHREALEPFYHLPLPGPAELEAVADKFHLLHTARKAGISVPRSFVDEPLPTGVRFPLIIKPLLDLPGFKRRFGRSVMKVENRAQLDVYLKEGKSHRLLVQEFIPGGEDRLWSYGAAFFRGLCLAEFTGRKLIQYPPGAGAGDAAVAQARWEPRVARAGRRLLTTSRFTGLAQVEFKAGPSGRLYVIEVNPRAWSWNYLPTACGVNLPLALYAALLGKRLPDRLITQTEAPLRWCYGRLWLLATLNLLLRGQAWRPILRLGLRRDNVKPIITLGDGGPWGVYLAQIARTLLGELAVRIRRV